MKIYHVFTYNPETTGNDEYSLSEKTARSHFKEIVKDQIKDALRRIEWKKGDIADSYWKEHLNALQNQLQKYKEGILLLEKITFDNYNDYGWSEMPMGYGIAWELIEVEE